jgi:hypothetical protein
MGSSVGGMGRPPPPEKESNEETKTQKHPLRCLGWSGGGGISKHRCTGFPWVENAFLGLGAPAPLSICGKGCTKLPPHVGGRPPLSEGGAPFWGRKEWLGELCRKTQGGGGWFFRKCCVPESLMARNFKTLGALVWLGPPFFLQKTLFFQKKEL